ncbi:hypothetical protein Bca4012_001167 [Brassica carinata]
MSDIFYIIRKLRHQRTLSDAELRTTSDKLAYLTEAGLNVEWLRPNLEVKKREAYLERKKRDAYEARMAYLERKKPDACEARIVELKQEVKKLELAKSGLKAELKIEKAKLNPPLYCGQRDWKLKRSKNIQSWAHGPLNYSSCVD